MSAQGGFSIDQLMELAGLSVASAVASEYSPESFRRVLVFAGPGNNGGDGIVAARHLYHFGYDVQICYPKRTDKPLYHGLVTQCQALGIEFVEVDQVVSDPLDSKADIVIDAMFGFSFKGQPRPPFDSLISALVETKTKSKSLPKIVAVDIPSGWDVEKGDESGNGVRPDMLVSLTTPKLCALKFTGDHHYVGGRFVPPNLAAKYGLKIPRYPGVQQCVAINGTGSKRNNDAAQPDAPKKEASLAAMRMTYTAGCLEERRVSDDPWSQFGEWFEEARNSGVKEANAMALATASPRGTPSLRYVLMKGYGPRGITFFTNYDSRKGKELEANPQAAVTFHWDTLERQVRFEGRIERLPSEESDEYWNSRPWEHQVGGLASRQSSVVLGGRDTLERRLKEVERTHPKSEGGISRPNHWGGYALRPLVIEFWQGRPSRLHDRLRYRLQEGENWVLERLAP